MLPQPYTPILKRGEDFKTHAKTRSKSSGAARRGRLFVYEYGNWMTMFSYSQTYPSGSLTAGLRFRIRKRTPFGHSRIGVLVGDSPT